MKPQRLNAIREHCQEHVYIKLRHTEKQANKIEDEILAIIAQRDDLLGAVKAQHVAIDILFAMLIESRDGFMPSKCGRPWDAAILGNAAVARAEGRKP